MLDVCAVPIAVYFVYFIALVFTLIAFIVRTRLVGVCRQYGGLCVTADEKWCELFDRCYTSLLGTASVSAQVASPTPELSQRVWQNIAAILNNASTSSYR